MKYVICQADIHPDCQKQHMVLAIKFSSYSLVLKYIYIYIYIYMNYRYIYSSYSLVL